MNYKGDYNGETQYSVGDVVVFTDGLAYRMFREAAAGTTPHNVRHWVRLEQPFQEVVILFHEMFGKVPGNISEDAISLKGSEDNEYLITVDDTGDTPELSVTLIEEEE